MAFLITEISLAQRDTPGFWRTLSCVVAPYDHTDHISHMLHSINFQEST